MSNSKDNRIQQLEEQLERVRKQNTELHAVCQQQRDSLAAQQEAIVQLNISLDSTLACLAQKYGERVQLEDGTAASRVTISTEEYPGVLDRCEVTAVIADGCYVITVTGKSALATGEA